jgi:hypothetical protein
MTERHALATRPHPCPRRAGLRRQATIVRVLLLLTLLLPAGACADRGAVSVRLQADPPPGAASRQLELRAQVSGPSDGLRYRWFSVLGVVDPQESDLPTATFTFADGAARDLVSVEVWRDGRQLSRGEVGVTLDTLRLRADTLPTPSLRVAITTIPPAEPGGPETRASIAGRVEGVPDSTFRIVLYARASEVWYIQPMPSARHVIGDGGQWGSWTHTGSSYAALLVRRGFVPLPLYDVLPQVGGHVIARAVVEGARP